MRCMEEENKFFESPFGGKKMRWREEDFTFLYYSFTFFPLFNPFFKKILLSIFVVIAVFFLFLYLCCHYKVFSPLTYL